MNPHKSRIFWALALGLALTGVAAGTAQADPIKYSVIGQVDTPTSGSTQNLVYYNGLSLGSFMPPGSIDLGSFNVSALSKTVNATYTNTPFSVIVSSGGTAGQKIMGVINGQVGPSAASPALTATITGSSQFGNDPLPFQMNLPLNTPMALALSNGAGPAPTGVSFAAVPEPTSIAVFTVALGGLGLWHRRRRSGT